MPMNERFWAHRAQNSRLGYRETKTSEMEMIVGTKYEDEGAELDRPEVALW